MALIQDDFYLSSGWSNNVYKFSRVKLYLAIQGEYKKFGITKNFGERVASYATHNPITPEFIIFYSRNIRAIETYLNRLFKRRKNNRLLLNEEWTDHSFDKVMNMIDKAIKTDVNWQNRYQNLERYKNNIWRFVGSSLIKDDRFKGIPAFREKYFDGHVLFEFRYSNYRIIFSNSDGYDPNSKKYVPINKRNDRSWNGEKIITAWDKVNINKYFNVEFYLLENDAAEDIDVIEYKILETLKEINISNKYTMSNPKLKNIEWKISPDSENTLKHKGIFFRVDNVNEYSDITFPFNFMNEFFAEFKVSDEKFNSETEHMIEDI